MQAGILKSGPVLTMAAVAAAAVIGIGTLVWSDDLCAADAASFAEDVMPIFRGRCVGCHQPGAEAFDKSGLDLSSYAGVMKGTKFGAMVVPREPDSSNLMWLLDWRASTRRPSSFASGVSQPPLLISPFEWK